MAEVQVTERVRIAEAAGSLWSKIGGFGAMGRWHPMLARVEADGESPGAVRTARGKNGSLQIERLLEGAPDGFGYRYGMARTGMPVMNDYVAEFRVADLGGDTSEVVWHAAFKAAWEDAAKAEAWVRAFFRAGLDNLSDQYGPA